MGIAVGLNVVGNQRGTAAEIDPGVVAIFAKWGFAWGGDWQYTDPCISSSPPWSDRAKIRSLDEVVEMVDREPTNRYRKLPEPIRVEDMIETTDVEPVLEEKDGPWREIEWMLRVAGAG